MSYTEDVEKLNQEALRKFGKALDDLTEEELDALYTAYAAERDVLNADYLSAGEQMNKLPQARQAGNVYSAPNALEYAASLANTYVGKKRQDQARAGLEGLAAKEAMGRRAGGQVAAGRTARLIDAMRGPTPTPAAPAGATPPAGATAAPRTAPAQPQRPAQPQGGTTPQGMPSVAVQGAEGAMQPPPFILSPEERRRLRALRMARMMGR